MHVTLYISFSVLYQQDRCYRERCRYFHPPRHIKDRLVNAGRQFGAMMSNIHIIPGGVPSSPFHGLNSGPTSNSFSHVSNAVLCPRYICTCAHTHTHTAWGNVFTDVCLCLSLAQSCHHATDWPGHLQPRWQGHVSCSSWLHSRCTVWTRERTNRHLSVFCTGQVPKPHVSHVTSW